MARTTFAELRADVIACGRASDRLAVVRAATLEGIRRDESNHDPERKPSTRGEEA